MRTSIKYFFFCALVTLSGVEVCAQNAKIDSLVTLLKNAKHDTTRIRLRYEIGEEAQIFRITYWDSLRADAVKYKMKKYEANSLNNIGYIYQNQGLVEQGLEYYMQALKVREEIGDVKDIAYTLNNLGSTYYNQGQLEKALEYYEKSLKIQEKIGDKKGIAYSFNNIGSVYDQQGKGEKNNPQRSVLFKKALEYYIKGFKIREAIGDKPGIGTSLNNIGSIYYNLGELEKALDYYLKALKIRQEIGSKQSISHSLNNIGLIYLKQKKYQQAEVYSGRSLQIAEEIGYPENIRNACERLSLIYKGQGKYEKAYNMHVRFKQMADSINNTETQKVSMKKQVQYDFEKKQTADSIKNAEQIKQEELKHNQEIQQQRIYTYGGVVGFLLMLIVAGVSFRAFKNKQKANIIIEEQKKLVEEKQKDILDSIHYAKRIQQSLLPTEKYIDKTLKRLK